MNKVMKNALMGLGFVMSMTAAHAATVDCELSETLMIKDIDLSRGGDFSQYAQTSTQKVSIDSAASTLGSKDIKGKLNPGMTASILVLPTGTISGELKQSVPMINAKSGVRAGNKLVLDLEIGRPLREGSYTARVECK
jgi:hypothetical protein